MRLHEELRVARIKQIEIAHAIGAPPETVNRWLKGRHYPSGKHLPALLSFLNQPYLLHRMGRTKPVTADELRVPIEAA